MTEEWKPIIIDDEIWQYEVSNMGRVRSLNYRGTGKIEILKQTEDKDGYLFVNLCKNGKPKMYKVHRLVATMFIPNPQNKPTVNHIDENKHNNHVNNLEWMTMKEQQRHGTAQERRVSKLKGKGVCVRCVETQVIYKSITQAERETGLSQEGICRCCKGKQKTCGKLHWEYVD